MGGGDQDLKVEAIRGGVRDLKIDAAAAMMGGLKTKEAAAVGGGDGGLRMKKEAAAMEGVDTLKRNEGVFNVVGVLAMKYWKEEAEAADDRGLKRKEAIRPAEEEEGGILSIGEGDRDLKAKMKDAGGSEGGDTLKKKPWEVEGGILKLKKELFAAVDDMIRIQSPKSMARREARALAARKKKMKVVRTKFTKDFIDNMATFSFVVLKDLSDEELAQRSPTMREVYAAVKVYEAKQRQYWDTLAAQQEELGYAEDEIEVTDDEEEEMVKN